MGCMGFGLFPVMMVESGAVGGQVSRMWALVVAQDHCVCC